MHIEDCYCNHKCKGTMDGLFNGHWMKPIYGLVRKRLIIMMHTLSWKAIS